VREGKAKTLKFALCVRNTRYAASLGVRKLYPVLQDSDAEANGMIRVIDESGEDYLFPRDYFSLRTTPPQP
jgi:hypothetical protein